MEYKFSLSQVADILSVSKRTVKSWFSNGNLVPQIQEEGQYWYTKDQLFGFPEFKKIFNTRWEEELSVTPSSNYKAIELFAGGGGLAIALEKSGFKSVLLNDIDRDSCKTLRANRPHWNVVEGDVSSINFSDYRGEVDLLSGGFPCQAFSYAGNKLGFEDTRGTLFFQFARAVKEVKPKIFLGENVRGLISHDRGRTLESMKSILSDLGYIIIEPKVLKAILYKVPQKRERLFLVGIRKDLVSYTDFKWPDPYNEIMTMQDALKPGRLYGSDVPISKGSSYPERKKKILEKVPQGGYWRDLPDELQKEYMRGSYGLPGGKTGMARRLSWDEPSLTLTCAPAQKQTERCHPEETRPLTIREYARVQTFPDDWEFCGSISSMYKQIGNAVPVNLGFAMARSLVRILNQIDNKNIVENKESYSNLILEQSIQSELVFS